MCVCVWMCGCVDAGVCVLREDRERERQEERLEAETNTRTKRSKTGQQELNLTSISVYVGNRSAQRTINNGSINIGPDETKGNDRSVEVCVCQWMENRSMFKKPS